MPNTYSTEHRDYHPVVKVLEGCFNYDEFFRDEDHVREARRAYYAHSCASAERPGRDRPDRSNPNYLHCRPR